MNNRVHRLLLIMCIWFWVNNKCRRLSYLRQCAARLEAWRMPLPYTQFFWHMNLIEDEIIRCHMRLKSNNQTQLSISNLLIDLQSARFEE